MNMKRNKKLAGLLCLLLCAMLLLQGCGGKDKAGSASSEEPKTVGEDAAGEEEQDADGGEEESQGEDASGEASQEETPSVELTDTVRWFNASYAILTELNGWDYNVFAGLPANDIVRDMEIESLEQWWSVTDRESADETLKWALEEGHRTGFAENMKMLEEDGLGNVAAEERLDFMLNNYEVTEEEAQSYVDAYGMYEQYGAGAIDGWDYCRAMNLVSFYYLAQYYTEEEALDQSLEIAKAIQPLFTSWDDLVDSYLRGYEYWAEESSQERREVYEDLKSRPDNPYAVDFNTTLEKTW